MSIYTFHISFVCFFFFQAEDGIRDYKVTGVQTCALPIWRATGAADAGAGREIGPRLADSWAKRSRGRTARQRSVGSDHNSTLGRPLFHLFDWAHSMPKLLAIVVLLACLCGFTAATRAAET